MKTREKRKLENKENLHFAAHDQVESYKLIQNQYFVFSGLSKISWFSKIQGINWEPQMVIKIQHYTSYSVLGSSVAFTNTQRKVI